MSFRILFPPVKALGALGARFRDALLRRNDASLQELAAASGDEELAQIIDSEDVIDKLRAFRAVSSDRRASVLVNLSEYSQETILGALTKEELAAVIDTADSDEAVDVIQMLDDAARARIVTQLRQRDPHGVLPLLAYGEDTAGGIMQSEMLRVRADATVAGVRKQIAGATSRPHSQQIYVVDENDALVGTVAPLKLLQADIDAPIASLMHSNPPAALASTDQEEVATIFDEHDLVELPVVGAKGKLIGIITADDVLAVMEKEYAEDISRIVGADEDDHIEDPVLLTFRRRFPWLLVNLATAILAASVVGLFQDTIQKVVILAAFMPIVAGMGGNTATQTLGVVIRAIALGDLNALNLWRTIRRQMFAGLLNGIANGAVMGVIAYAWTKNLTLGVVIFAAMIANMLVAGLGGAGIPVIMRSLKIDPALASTVFVTTLTDICGFFVFLGLAQMFL